MTAAANARGGAHWDELHDGVGGEFAFDDAKLWYYEVLTLADAEDPARAEHAAAVAISLYKLFRRWPGRTAVRPLRVFSWRGPG